MRMKEDFDEKNESIYRRWIVAQHTEVLIRDQ
jgi:hypothetical protein